MEGIMYRRTNRSSFLGKPNASCLAIAYGKLVAIELTIKDEMGPAASSGWQHDLQVMLTRFAHHNRHVPSGTLNSLAVQFANRLGNLSCTDKSGARIHVPSNNYPYMRYIMHEWDGTEVTDTKEDDIVAVSEIANRIINILLQNYGVVA
jgi:hypothetical protein